MSYPPPGNKSPISNALADPRWSGAQHPSSTEYYRYNTFLRDDSGLPGVSKKAFAISQISANEVVINGGVFTIHGLFSTGIDSTNYTLVGSTCVVYVTCFLYNETAQIALGSTRPMSSSTHVRIPLATYTNIGGTGAVGDADGPNYIINSVHHDGDINLGSYIR